MVTPLWDSRPRLTTLVRTATKPAERAGAGDALILAFQGSRPLASPLLLSFGDADEVVLGRADATEVDADEVGGRRCLRVNVADLRMSSRHARIVRVGSEWVLHDE